MASAVMKIYTHKGVIKTIRLRGSLCNDRDFIVVVLRVLMLL